MSERNRANETSSGNSPRGPRPAVGAGLAALLSLLVPGLGQIARGHVTRGALLLVSVLALGALVLWSGSAVLAMPLVAVWLWGVWDAYRLATGRRGGVTLPILLGLIVLYGLSVEATEMRPARLVTGWPAIRPFIRALFQPELFAYPTEDVVGLTPFQVPCVDPLPPPSRAASAEPRVTTSVPCAAIGDTVTVSGEGFLPETEGEFWWISPIGDRQRLSHDGEVLRFVTDEQGRFSVDVVVPLAIPLTSMPPEGETQTHVIRPEQHKPYGSPQPTQTLLLVLDKIGETIALAFLATVLGVIFAVPVSFLAARNLMGGNRVTLAVYYGVRTILNVVRSIETLIWAIVFAVWVGLGPYDGMLALLIHTIAALAKLYSEAIESIDPGPIEAVRATGASWPQVVTYAVLPQITPTFASFTLYRWDINVRMSTVIGLVSDAGLGFLVTQWIRLNRFSSMATAIIAIVLVVAILDYVSGWARQRILVGSPTVRHGRSLSRLAGRTVLIVGFAAMFVWSWGVAQVSLVDLVQGAPQGLRLMRDFMVPEMFTRPVEEHTVGLPLPAPCPAGAAPVPVAAPEGEARVGLSVACGEVGDPLVIQGENLPPDTDVSVRWTLADGAFLRVRENCCTTDAQGGLRLETRIHPLMEMEPDQTAPAQVTINWREVIGGPQLSDAFKTVVDLSIVTLLTALLATTLGSFFAIPLSFFAARNITGWNRLGRSVYYGSRTVFNLARSVEPLILVLIAAAWVGAGPFAGMLALGLWNIPNLAKLFSETIEEIEPGPVEAVTATGASWAQRLVFAVFPQLVPKFLAFILYQWDINLRMSTVIGFAGGGGLGQQFRLWVGLNQYAEAGMAVWAIVVMVWSMDLISAKAREKLV